MTHMAESKKPGSHSHPKPKGGGHKAKEPKKAHKASPAPKPHADRKPKAAPAKEHKPSGAPKREKKAAPKRPAQAPAKPSEKGAPPGKAPAKPEEKGEEEVEIVEAPTRPEYHAAPKPALSPEQRAGLAERRRVAARRPRFRRQQWYEYKRLSNTGWRRPTGIDSAMRRHFGYEQSVVRVGFGGPRVVRGLHPSGFREVHVQNASDLKGIDPKTQAARVSATLGTRKLKLLYAEADKLGVRVLNRRNLE